MLTPPVINSRKLAPNSYHHVFSPPARDSDDDPYIFNGISPAVMVPVVFAIMFLFFGLMFGWVVLMSRFDIPVLGWLMGLVLLFGIYLTTIILVVRIRKTQGKLVLKNGLLFLHKHPEQAVALGGGVNFLLRGNWLYFQDGINTVKVNLIAQGSYPFLQEAALRHTLDYPHKLHEWYREKTGEFAPAMKVQKTQTADGKEFARAVIDTEAYASSPKHTRRNIVRTIGMICAIIGPISAITISREMGPLSNQVIRIFWVISIIGWLVALLCYWISKKI